MEIKNERRYWCEMLLKYVCGSQKYDLCIRQKLFISRADPNVLLNKSGHVNKFTLKCFIIYKII